MGQRLRSAMVCVQLEPGLAVGARVTGVTGASLVASVPSSLSASLRHLAVPLVKQALSVQRVGLPWLCHVHADSKRTAAHQG